MFRATIALKLKVQSPKQFHFNHLEHPVEILPPCQMIINIQGKTKKELRTVVFKDLDGTKNPQSL